MKLDFKISNISHMINRTFFLEKIKKKFGVHRIVAILGPRQCGKTTLAKQIFNNGPSSNYFDLESLTDLQRLEDNAQLTLERLNGLVVIDEIQRLPNLFPTLRFLHDQNETRQFLILGSASKELIRQSSESLAGRIGYMELPTLSGFEVDDMQRLWLNGGFPRAYLAGDTYTSTEWRKEYIRTFLEQDIPNLGFRIAPENIRRFWTMLAHYHGQIMNYHEIGQSLDLSGHTVKQYLDILAGTFMIRIVQPWHTNLKKRQVKSPKIYFRDSGLFHTLLEIETWNDLLTHRVLGASWEGFAMEQIIVQNQIETPYFWATHGEAEIDLVVHKKGQSTGFEFKHTDRPKITPSITKAIEALQLQKVNIIYPGKESFPLSENVEAIGLNSELTHQFLL